MRCPACGFYCGDDGFDDFDDDDYLDREEICRAIEDAREAVARVQVDLMTRRLACTREHLDAIIDRLDALDCRDSFGPTIDVSDLEDALEAIDAGRIADAVCHLERYLHPSKAAKARTIEAAQ